MDRCRDGRGAGWPIAPAEEVESFEGDRLVSTSRPEPALAGGLGAHLLPAPEGPWRVVSLLPGGVAAKAGLPAGDLITDVDGIPTSRSTPLRIRGRVGTPVRLRVRSGGREREVTLIRRATPSPPARIMVEPGAGREYRATSQAHVRGRWQKIGERIYVAAP